MDDISSGSNNTSKSKSESGSGITGNRTKGRSPGSLRAETSMSRISHCKIKRVFLCDNFNEESGREEGGDSFD